MAMYLGSNKISEVNNVIGSDSYNVKRYLNNESIGGGYLDGIESIRIFAYYNQTQLEVITLPETLKTLGSRAFYGCISLREITCKAKTPPTINSFDDYYFGENVEIIYIPVGTLDAYSTANKWSQYADKFVEKEEL